MILFSHPRSGSEWFLSGLTDYRYILWEMFGLLNDIPGTKENANWGSISFGAKINMMNVGAKLNRAYKIQLHQIDLEIQKDTWPILKAAIQKHDLYLLTRRDTKAVLVSFIIARHNNYNFHRSKLLLKNTGIISRQNVEDCYNLIYKSLENYKNLFDYKECFVYEDLLSGVSVPKTLNWNPNKSYVVKRSSMDLVDLIDNKDEVLGWIDELILGQQ